MAIADETEQRQMFLNLRDENQRQKVRIVSVTNRRKAVVFVDAGCAGNLERRT
jgi:hypothetical protein